MQITIYRGTHEVGGTMIELKTKNTRILLDAGYPLFYQGAVIDDSIAKRPWQELLALGILPDVKGLYRWDKPEFDAVLISHAHSDHFGLLSYVHPEIPIFLTAITEKLIEMSLTFPIEDFARRKRNRIIMYEPFEIGDFTLKPFLMDHSAYGAGAFEIRAEGKLINYTGDFRGHGRRGDYLERFLSEAEKEPDLLLIEGTTLGRSGEKELTEKQLKAQFEEILLTEKGIVLCQPTSQSIDRVISFYEAAEDAERIFVMDIYMANLLYEIKRIEKAEGIGRNKQYSPKEGCASYSDQGSNAIPLPGLLHPEIRVFAPITLTKKMDQILGPQYGKRFKTSRISRWMLRRKQKKIVMLVRPAMLPDLKLMGLKNGMLVYSMWQAYRNKPHQVKLETYLKSRGFSDRYLHTSGHAFKDDIKKVIKGLSPKEIVPIHTFEPEVFFEFSKVVTIREDGIPFIL
jgi:ribonuclease J